MTTRTDGNHKDKDLIKSVNDKLNYKYLELKNGLKAIVVSDPSYADIKESNNDDEEDKFVSDTDTESGTDSGSDTSGGHSHSKSGRQKKMPNNEKLSAVALCVRTGSFADPKQVQGLAHLVEHVITMGSEKFPKENELDEYLTSRGGYQNAHTEFEYTLFEIEVQRKHLYGALQRLAHFFISPLLRADSIERETKPVDTEFQEASSDDDVRLEQLFHNFANKDHPFNDFAWGNTHSLKEIPKKNGTNTQKCVKEFVAKHYNADNIHVVIQSQEKLETLEQWVNELFSRIESSDNSSEDKSLKTKDKKEDKSKSENSFGNPFDKNPNFNRLYLVEPVNETDQLIMYWCLPPAINHFRQSPLDYLGHLIGHEGKGSLISLLRRENLALELAAGVEDSGFALNQYSTMFVIQIKLTDLGNKNLDKIVEYVYEYINILHNSGPQEWFFNELKKIEENRFDWNEEIPATDYVKKLAVNMNYLPLKYVLRGNRLYKTFDKELIQKFQKQMTPQKACYVHLSTHIIKDDDKDVQTEKWFGTKYKVLEVPKSWLHIKFGPNSQHFKLPEKNRFIAEDFSLKTHEEQEFVTKILDKTRLKLWFKGDNKFKLPKAIVKLHLISPHILDPPNNVVMNDLLVEILNQKLSEDIYEATMASLDWAITQTNVGLVLGVGGFNDKLDELLLTIIDRIIHFDVDDKVFVDVKKHLSKQYYNTFIDPTKLNKTIRLSIISKRHINSIHRRQLLASVEKKHLLEYIKKLLSNFFIEGLIQGNMTQKEAISLMDKIEAKFSLSAQMETPKEPQIYTSEIPEGDHCCRVLSLSDSNKNSSITNYYQLKPANIQLQTLVSVLSSLMEEPCFDNLRTKEGLGYYVSTTDYNTNGISGYGVSVNSSGAEFNCTFVDKRIENFLKEMVEYIMNLEEETFKQHINSLIIAKNAPDLQLSEEFNRNWSEIISFNYCFNRLAKEIKCLEKINFNDYKDWSCEQILKDPKRRKLSVQVVGNGKKSLTECVTIDGKDVKPIKRTKDDENSEAGLKKYKFIHLKPKTCDTKQVFIEDIPKFKKTLNKYPVHKVSD